MAKQLSPNEINGYNDDWTLDSRTGLPYSGGAIQRFIKNRLHQSAGAAWFNQANYTLYFFNTAEDRDAFVQDQTQTSLILSTTPLNLSSEMFRIALVNNTGTTSIQAATNQDNIPISIDFDVQRKLITDSSWTSTGNGAVVHVYIDAGSVGQYTEIPGVGGLLVAGTTFTLNAREYLIAGDNRLRVTFTSETDETLTASIVYTITMSEMYIEIFNNTWYNAIIEGIADNYKLGGFRIVGALSKTLKLEIYSGNSMVLSFEQLIGTSSYVDTPYNYGVAEGLNLSALPTGVYICKAYLVSGSLASIPISYNFMHVAAADKLTAKLVCVNNTASFVYNYSDNAICEYAIYNSGFSTGTPHINIQLWSGTTPTTAVDRDYPDILTGVINTLEYTVEWLVESTINLSLYFNISMGSSSQTASIPIDNSATYPAESGALFYINETSRSNNDANRESIINVATAPSTEIAAIWEKMAWVDGIDGHTADENGRKALLIPAGSKCTIPYKMLSGENMTFEICYKVMNVSDYEENVITVADNPTLPGFQGIRIKPTHFTIHSASDVDDSKDTTRGKALEDEQVVHLLIVIQNSFSGITGKNLVTAYVNGCKALQFPYDNGTIFESNANLVIGSSSADVYVYSCRVYRKVLGVISAEQNYINSLRTLEERETAAAAFNSVLNTGTHEISYDAVVNSSKNYNFFVIEMKDGASIPSRANEWSKETSAYADWEMHFGEHPEWDWKIFGLLTEGQGTTSMNYYRWNIRGRIDKTNSTKKLPVAYYDMPTVGLDGKKIFHILPASDSKTVHFDGAGNHPAVMRITAKINQASSMQGHKIGATGAYNALYEAIGLQNEAQEFASDNGLPLPKVAVYQYPAFGFARKVVMGVETYEFIGLFTIGPDKGDKPTFGYNIDDSIKENLISMEGTNHARKLVMFQYPWNEEVEYRASNECLNIVTGNNTFDDAWEVSNCHDLDTDKVESQAAVQEALEDEFRPAYECAWNNSTLIFPVALNDATYGGSTAADVLANINNVASSFYGMQYNDRLKHSDMEFWIEGEYILYHYDIKTNQYVAGINLVTQNGSPVGATLGEKNEWFKTQRRNRFIAEAPNYWDIQDTAYHYAFIVGVGATDNFGKNSYPYKMKRLADGGRWKWRQDDLDTIFDTDNLGTDSKPYYIEFMDSANGSVVFGGGNSVFWNLIHDAFWEDYGINKGVESIGRDIVSAMATLGGGSNPFIGVVNFFKKYFWDKSQNYFPQSAYNVDASFKYETGWLDTRSEWSQPDALDQSLGRHLEAERLWCTRRAIYIMSLFKVGPFRVYSDTSLGRITFRPISFVNPTVKPTLWMYPSVFFGEGSPEITGRTEAGQEHEFTGVYGTGGQTNFYFQATNYMESLGNWKDLVLASGYVSSISVVGAKLREFSIGEPHIYYTQEEISAAVEGDDAYGKTTDDVKELAVVTTNVPSLSFVNTKCLEEIEARNAASLTGSIDLSSCTRLLRAYFEGTNVTQVVLLNGSKIESLHLSDVTNTIVMKNLKFLADLALPSDVAIIRTLQVENCVYQDAFQMLKDCFNSNNAALQYIRLIWQGVDVISANDIHMLALIASNLAKDEETVVEYRGINAQGNIEGAPVIEGSVQMNLGMYMDDLAPLQVTQTEDYGEGLKRALSSLFGTLYVIYDPNNLYIRFEDAEAERVCLAIWGNGEGVSVSAAGAATTLNSAFAGNTTIQTFDELKYFGITATVGGDSNSGGDFRSCTNLRSVSLPDTCVTIGAFSFGSCSRLTDVDLGNGVRTIQNYAFNNCNSLVYVDIPATLTTIGGNRTFATSDNLNKRRVFIFRSTTPPSLGYANCFYKYTSGTGSINTGTRIYVPYSEDHSILNAYKAATNWSTYTNYIYELDENGNIPE